MQKLSLIGKILTLFKWFDIPITIFFVSAFVLIGIFGSWVFAMWLVVLAIIGIASSVVIVFLGDYLNEQQGLKKYPYFKFFIVILVWVVLFALIFILVLNLLP
jgi:hypothetical protein|tara:strand:+ start:409 stop:717 length:309 start_codon:yes stop_codon:yes gene_type:complete